jgi:DNA-binding transcriptional LysR family regulator
MTTGREPLNDTALEALLAEARSARPPPLPEGLQARLLADAAVAQTGQRLPAERPGRLWALRGWLADLGGLPICLLTPDMQNRRIIAGHLAAAGVSVTPRLETNSILVLISHVLQGGWATILPERSAAIFPAAVATPLALP